MVKRLRVPLYSVVMAAALLALVAWLFAGLSRTPQARPEPVVPGMISRFSGAEGGPESLQTGAAGTAAVNPNRATISGPIVGEPVAAVAFNADVRTLPQIRPVPKAPLPELEPFEREESARLAFDDAAAQPAALAVALNMPAPSQSFKGLNFASWGAGWPPDTNGDVGPNHYVQTVNTSIGIYSKTGTQLAAFTFDTLFTGTGTPCDDNNNGDPVVLYDPLADRWILTDFAWTNNDAGPYYECIAASQTGDPVSGGWWFYALRADDATHNWLNDYPKLGVWPDGIYMSANMFDCVNNCGTGTSYKGARVWALNRDDLYSGAALRTVLFDISSSYFSLIPSNFRGTAPPAGRPNFFVSNDLSVFALDVWKFTVNWTTPTSSTFTGPTQVTESTYSSPPSTIPSLNGNSLDSLGDRLMVQNQYRNLNGTESLWLTHTAGKTAPNTAGIRWYQVNVTGGTIATTAVQQGTYRPDSHHRWMPSLAVDKSGNMAVGYSVSSSTLYPEIRYAGRLATDALNTLGQGETTLIAGTGTQTNLCGGSTCTRWGDYSSMTVDPVDDCTFWYTTEYYEVSGGDWQTRIGSFKFPSCGTTPPPTSDTGFKSPVTQAAQTTSAGDNNGFESSAASALADDGVFALDNNSGTASSTSCTSTSRDKHRFYDYGFSLPAGTTILGIEVRLDAKVDRANNSPKMCVELSWDGGTTWTAAKSTANLTTSEATYTLGSASDTWGRTWTDANFSNANFRVRITNTASSTARDFSLDWVAVRVTYQGP